MIFKIKHIRHLFQNKQNSFWVCLLSLFFAFQSFSQNNSTDVEALIESVSQQLQNSVTDSTQVYKNMFKSVRLSKQVKDKKLLAKSYQNLAIWHQNNVTLDSTLYYLEKAQTTLKATDFNKLKAKNHLIKEDAHKDKREYSKALEADFKALKIYENINDQKGIAECYTRLCDLLYYQEKYTNGAEYCQQAIEIQKQLNVPKNLALSYRYKADNLLMLQEYEQALENISSAITVLENAGISKVSIAKNYNTRGNIYKHMNRFDDAIAEYQKCYQIATEHNAYNGVYVALANIGHVYRLQNNYDKALPYTLEAIEMMKKSGNIQNLRENYMHASDSYEALDQYKEALEYERLHSKMISDDSQEMIAQLESELQAKYESDKKDETIEAQDATISRQRQIQLLYIGIAVLLGFFLFAMYFTMKNIRKKREALTKLNTELAENQKTIELSNRKLKASLEELKATQAQLIQSEKMASLGELTAGIAHEIQNPLNFVNNFSEVSVEMIDEMKVELDKGDIEEVRAVSNDLKQNIEKILHHGKRADDIVKGMLQHSRINTGTKEPTDLNKLTDEYFRLAYHGLRAKDKSFNALLETDYDESIKTVNIVPQDIGRVILNLFTNAFYAVDDKKSITTSTYYKPKVSVSTEKLEDKIIIAIKDNGNGIPEEIIDKIFQPFFTTKPTGKGTGLGLSMSYDIIKAHNGELKVETENLKYTQFKIILPIKNTKDV